jgi:hypothetical protein
VHRKLMGLPVTGATSLDIFYMDSIIQTDMRPLHVTYCLLVLESDRICVS